MVDRYGIGARAVGGLSELEILRLENQQLRAAIQHAPKHRGHVLERMGPDRLLVSIAGGVAEVHIPPGYEVEVGEQIEMLGQNLGLLRTVDAATSTGLIERVVRVVDDRYVEVTRGSTTGLVVRGRHARDLEAGDRVILDNEGRVAYRKLPREEPVPTPSPGVDWDEIGGQDEAVAALREAIEGPLLDPDGYARYGLKMPKGALVAGPPGVGKTLLARAAATANARIRGGGKTAQGFIPVKGPELLNQMVGRSEYNIRELFEKARQHEKQHGYPATIFLDEGDALLMKRGSRAFEVMEKTIVPMFLAEMDGLTRSSAFVMVATNRPDMLDPAVTREGRLDLKITLRRPSKQACAQIIERRLLGCPTAGGTPAYFAELAADHMFSSRHALYMVHPQRGDSRRVTLADFVSGAMCDAVVARAKGLAVRRERAGGEPRGLCETDIGRAVDMVVEEQRSLQHDSEIADMMGSVPIREVRKIGAEPSPIILDRPGPDGVMSRAKVR